MIGFNAFNVKALLCKVVIEWHEKERASKKKIKLYILSPK